jgi:hypothetical protein
LNTLHAMSLEKGIILYPKEDQHKSSTEAELVGVHEVLPNVLLTKSILEGQEYGAVDVIVHPDI